MSEQDFGADSTLESQEEVVLETTDESEQIDVEALQAELEKQRELANNYKIRAEKAEKAKVAPQQAKPQQSTATASLEDQIALMKADVDVEDLGIVTEYAKFKKISIAEAVKSPIVKAELAAAKELRNSALAANTGPSKRGTGKTTDETLLENARNGKMPESEEDIARLFKLRRGIK